MELGKLFIGGISWDTNEDRLREYFRSFGEVLEAVIMKDRATGRARGFGFVVFADAAVAERVVMQKHMIDGRTVEAKKAVPRDDQNILNKATGSIHGSPTTVRTKKIFVGGLASSVTESDFKIYFEQFGRITDVVVMYDHNTQRPRGFGFITYDSEEAVDKVLLMTFHELNGKLVEVKRAVPKELSPGPSRSPLNGFSYPSRISSFLSGYNQGYNPNLMGGYGVRTDSSRYSPVPVGRGGFSPFGPGYETGLIFEPVSSPSYGGITNSATNLGYGRAMSPSFIGNMNRYNSPVSYAGGAGGNSSMLTPTGRNLWSDAGLNHASRSPTSGPFINSGSASLGSIGGSLWGSSSNSGQRGASGSSSYGTGNLNYRNEDFNGGSGGGYAKNNMMNVSPASHAMPNGRYDGNYSDIYGSGLFHGDSTWQQSSPSKPEGFPSFGFGIENGASDVMTENSAAYAGGYSVANRQTNRGIAA